MNLIQLLSFPFLLVLSAPSMAAISINEADPSLFELIALLFGGIGLFLIGIHFSGDYLRRAIGGKFAHFVLKSSNSLFASLLSGVTLGFLTQSGKTCALIVADFVQAGMLKSQKVALIVFFGNAGAALIALVALFDIKAFSFMLLGIAGLGLTFKTPKYFIPIYGTIFGLGMMMLGLHFVKEGANGIGNLDWIIYILHQLHSYYVIGFSFAFGFILTFVFRSNIATKLIVITFVATDLLLVPEGFAAIIAAQAGAGMMTYFYSHHAKGRAQQVIMQQLAFDFLVTLFFLILFVIEIVFQVPLLIALVKQLISEASLQMLTLVIAMQFGGALLLSLINKPISELIERYFQPTSVEVLSSTAFINEASLVSSVETNLLLIEKEQLRLMRRLPDYIDYVRGFHNDGDNPKQYSPKSFHTAYHIIAEKIASSLSVASSKLPTDAEINTLLLTTKLQEQLNQLENVVFEFTQIMQNKNINAEALELGKSIMESLDFMIMSAIDAVESSNDEEIDTLSLLTKDRSQMMMKLRDNYFHSKHDFTQKDRNFILDVTILLENTVQALSRYGVLMKVLKD